MLALAVGTATAIASTTPSDASSGTTHDGSSSAVRSLRHQIRLTRSRTLRTAYVAALPLPRHGHAERSATTIQQLAPILLRWQHRLSYYRSALARRLPVLQGLKCIHSYEGAWTSVSATSPAYYGGLQMDRTFELSYGADVVASNAGLDANAWSPHDQLMVAMRAYRQVGYSPWPNTAAACGLE